MAKICVRVGDELAAQVEKAAKELHYPSKSKFLRSAIRHKLKELGFVRQKEAAYHELLSSHSKESEIKDEREDKEKIHRSRFGLRDLLKHKYQYGQTTLCQ